MNTLIQTDNLGNNYRLVRTIDSIDWSAIKVMFRELFDKNYGNYRGQVLFTTSGREGLGGPTVHRFSSCWVNRQLVKIFNSGKTEFWEHFGDSHTIFDYIRKQEERKKLVAKLTDGLSIEDLRRAKIVVGGDDGQEAGEVEEGTGMKKITVVTAEGEEELQEYFHQTLEKYDGLCMDNETDTRTLAEALAHHVSEDLVVGIG